VTCVVAADGGNSKTDLVLASIEGDVLAQVRVAGTRPFVDGMPATASTLAAAAHSAAERAGATSISVGAFYLANVDLPEDETAATDELHRLGVAARVLVRNDVFAILRAGTTRGWGIAITAGAGINAVGVHPDGREGRFLALGDVSGDWGGGYSVGVAGLGAAVRAGDGRGPETVLRSIVADAFRAPPEDVAVGVSQGQIPRRALRDLAPAVLRAADDGDAAACGIVLRLADNAVEFAVALLRRLDLLDTDPDVVLGGRLLQSGNRLLVDRIRERVTAVAPHAVVRVLDTPPVAGALAAALELAGASTAAQQRARTQLASSWRSWTNR
jgi:N-acetylglucosamine kinase-like BadF-type ATPase